MTAPTPPQPDAPAPTNSPATPHDPSVFWLVIAVAGTLMSMAWLGACETANNRSGHILQQLNANPDPHWHDLPVTQEELRAQIAVDAEGNPIPDPLPPNFVKAINDAWAPHAMKAHLYLMIASFGTMLFPTALVGLIGSINTFRHRYRISGLVLGTLCVLILLRALQLGLLRHGILTTFA